MDRRRGAKIGYVKEIRFSKEIPSAAVSRTRSPEATKSSNKVVLVKQQQQQQQHWYRKKFQEREQLLEKHKKSGWRLNDQRANKNGFHHDVYWITGDLYRGNWKFNKKEGSGIHSYCTGNRYEGDWKKSRRQGYGTFYIREDGKYRVVYKGYWKGGRLHGPGYLHCAYGEVYEGEFEDGVRSGYGRQTYWCAERHSYDVYVGHWRADKREGRGRLSLVNGDVYEGSFSNDMKHGPGVFFYTTTSCRYQGLWKDDVAVSGTYTKLDPLEPVPLPALHSCLQFDFDFNFSTPLPENILLN